MIETEVEEEVPRSRVKSHIYITLKYANGIKVSFKVSKVKVMQNAIFQNNVHISR